MMQLELSKWGDGTIRLVWWDNLRGNDIVIDLRDDGKACLSVSYEAQKYEDKEVFEPVADLVTFLRDVFEAQK